MAIIDNVQKVRPYITDEDGNHVKITYATQSNSVIMDEEGLTLSESEVEMPYAEYKALEEAGEINPKVKYIVPDYPGGSGIKVDEELDVESENAIANKAVALGKADNLLYDEETSELQLRAGERVLSTAHIEGGSASIQIDVTTESESFVGSTVKVLLNGVVKATAVFDENKKVSVKVKEYGTYKIVVEDDETSVNVTAAQLYTVNINESPKATINVSTSTILFYGKDVTCTDGNTTLTKSFSDLGMCTFRVKTTGTWTVTCEGRSNTVNVTDLTSTYETEVHIPVSHIAVTTKEEEWHGTDVVLKKNGTTVETKQFSVLGTCDFTVYEMGEYTIESNEKVKTLTIDELDKDYAVSINGLEIVTFANGTDEQIAAMIEAHYNNDIDIKDYWAVGDVRSVNLSAMGNSGITNSRNVTETHSAQTIEIVIASFDHYDLATPINGHTKAAIALIQKDCMKLETNPNFMSENSTYDPSIGSMINYTGTHTNVGGWKDCARRTWCNNAYKNALPTILKNIIKTVSIYTDNTGGGSDTASYVTATQDNVFLLAEYEIFGARTYANSAEQNYQKQLEYFKTATNRYKMPKWNSATQNSAIWFERSPSSSGSTFFCSVYHSGVADYYDAGSSRGVAPAFCV